ncbi:MAG TPA: hypothetical protein DD435_17000 [Cyanobacteria bacterium UBA8530]|nr:hypothetical protein [Cyanobacteria bacterium UBA8530]
MSEILSQALFDPTTLLLYLTIQRPEVFQASVQFLLSTGTALAETLETSDPSVREGLARLISEKKIFQSSPTLDGLVRSTRKWDLADHLSAGEVSVLATAEEIGASVLTDNRKVNKKAAEHLGPRVIDLSFVLKNAFEEGIIKEDDLEEIRRKLEAVAKYR